MKNIRTNGGQTLNLIEKILLICPNTRFVRYLGLCILYFFIFFISHILAWNLRFDFEVGENYKYLRDWAWFWELPIFFMLLALFGQFNFLFGYFSLPDLKRIIAVTTIFSLIILGLRYAIPSFGIFSRGVILIKYIVLTGGLVAARLGMRMLYEHCRKANENYPTGVKRVAILGAGDVGATLVKELKSKRGIALYPVIFLDDDNNKWGQTIHGIPIVGKPEELAKFKTRYGIENAIIAMPSAPAKRIGELVKLLQNLRIDYQTVPSMEQLATGRVKVTQLRAVDIEDLLGREVVKLDMENIRNVLDNEVVIVTGAGGSIGRELCRQILNFSVTRLILVERAEGQLFEIEQELRTKGFSDKITPVVADILDVERMEWIFRNYKPGIIFHAAAHKHVPMMEYHPSEAINNNAIGTAQLADLAVKYNVKRFVLISTDKAINPTSVMGATKRLAELYIQSLFEKNGNRTLFMAVRFGNVLGSSGSVITIFRKQIAEGGPVTVTHPDMRRYFMTITEAVSLVLQSAAQGMGGEIFVLDMGEPVKIVDLARQMIELSGLRPGIDIEIVFTG
ncbi:MAG: polysaccharide biosynthesis protein, partial [Verrucomicrobiia bacterium]